MTITVLKAWIKELRSEKYKQCKGQMRKGEEGDYSYCCLGVLNVILDSTFTENGVRIEEGVIFLPETIFDNKFTQKLETEAYLKNDSGSNFKEIADWLEETLLRK